MLNAARSLIVLAQTAANGIIDPPLPPAASGYGVQLFQSVVALAAVCFAAWWVLRWASRQGFGKGPAGRHIRVIERVMLDPRRSLFLVEVGTRVMLLGTSEQTLSLLAEIQPGDLGASATPGSAAPDIAVPRRFADVLARIRGEAPTSTAVNDGSPSTVVTADAAKSEHRAESSEGSKDRSA